MRILLHIGSEKTGSTSLQATFSKARRQLADTGILYPALQPLASHSILAVPFFRERLPREFFQKMGRDKASVDEIALTYWQEVAAQVSRTPRIDTLLISGEHFLYVDDHQALVQHLTALFPGCQIEMLCYLRDPVSFYGSFLKQRAKASSKLFWPRNENWSEKLIAWSNVGQLSVREFAPDTLVRGDLVHDVMTWIAPDLAERCPIEPTRRNESISAESAQIMHGYRQHVHGDSDDLFLPDSQRLFNALKQAEVRLPRPKNPSRLQPGVAERARLAAVPDMFALRAALGFAFRDETLYDEQAARAACEKSPALEEVPQSIASIFRLRDFYLRKLQAEAFAQVLQGFGSRERAS